MLYSSILGDINIDLLKPQDPLTIKYTNILNRITFTSQISKPTRITNTTSTIIDHILINNCNVSVISGILELQITDHLPVSIFIKKVKHTCQKGLENLTYRRNTKEIDKTLFFTELENNLNYYFKIPADGNQLDLMFTNFISDLKATIDKHASLQKISRKKRKLLSKPWITKGILVSTKNKQKCIKPFTVKVTISRRKYIKSMLIALLELKAYQNDYTFNINFIKIEIIHSKLGILFAS